METYDWNVLRNNPYLCKVSKLRRLQKCAVCGHKISDFLYVKLTDGTDTVNIRGKICSDCDIIHVSENMPEEVLEQIHTTFGNRVLIVGD